MKRGIAEKSVYVYNPLPAASDEEVLKRAFGEEDNLAEPSKRSPFEIRWEYSGGLDKEFVKLLPGERRVLRVSDSKSFLHDLAEQGGVVHALDATEEQILEAAVKGVTAAQRFYNDRGNKRVVAYRKRHGQTKEEIDENRHEIHSYFTNQAKADILKEHLATLRRKLGALRGGSKKSAAA